MTRPYRPLPRPAEYSEAVRLSVVDGSLDRSSAASLAFSGAGPGVAEAANLARSIGRVGRFLALESEDGRGHS